VLHCESRCCLEVMSKVKVDATLRKARRSESWPIGRKRPGFVARDFLVSELIVYSSCANSHDITTLLPESCFYLTTFVAIGLDTH
jgi:hypothetical protein